MHPPRKREWWVSTTGGSNPFVSVMFDMWGAGDPDFNFPEWGVFCIDCEASVDLIHCRKSQLCNACEFDTLTPPAWLEIFLVSLARWKTDMAS